MTEREELDEARAELAAWYAALEELRLWPELPKVQYGVRLDLNGHETVLYVEPERLVGLMKAIRDHAQTLLPTGKQAVEAWYQKAGLESELYKARELVPSRDEMDMVALAADVVENHRPDLRAAARLRAFVDRMRGKERA